jgi:hypothetical protein
VDLGAGTLLQQMSVDPRRTTQCAFVALGGGVERVVE